MKTKLLLLIGLCAIGCTTDNQEEVNCKCGTIIEKVYFNFPSFTVLKVKNDCTGNVETINVNGNQGELNGKWCQ